VPHQALRICRAKASPEGWAGIPRLLSCEGRQQSPRQNSPGGRGGSEVQVGTQAGAHGGHGDARCVAHEGVAPPGSQVTRQRHRAALSSVTGSYGMAAWLPRPCPGRGMC